MGNLMREVRSWLDGTEKVLQLLQEEKDLSNENKIHETIEVGFSSLVFSSRTLLKSLAVLAIIQNLASSSFLLPTITGLD